MMKSGHQQDMLECTTEPLPDHIHGKSRNEDESDEELEASIQNSMTKLISQLDVDNNLGTGEVQDGCAFLSLMELRGNGADQCGYKCIAWPNVNQSNCVYAFSVNDTSNQHTITYAPNVVSKVTLLWLAVQSVKQNVEELMELSHINPNGMVESIQEWSRIAFRDRTTRIIDE
jgi:hypothetical protein